MAQTATLPRRARKKARSIGKKGLPGLVGRLGLIARTGFYFVLAGLVVDVAVQGGSGGQANTHGVLTAMAGAPLGMAAIAAAALGFLVFGAVRLWCAVTDSSADVRERLLTGLQGAFYLGLTWIPLSFLLGSRSTGSEHAQHQEAATALSWPGGRAVVIAIGLIVLGVCAYQIRSALTQDFTDGLRLGQAPRWVCRLVEATGTVGIVARALVFGPVGVFLIVAAVQADPRHAKGLDYELAVVARQSWWGPLLLAVVAAGLVVFAAYSLLEARYREVESTR